MAPTSNTWACRHERWTKSGAKARMIAAKRAGIGGMTVSLGGDATSLTITPASSPHLAARQIGQSRAKLNTEVDAATVLALEREEMINLLLTSHWDHGERAASHLERLPAGTHK